MRLRARKHTNQARPFDWPEIKNAELTLELSRRGRYDIPDDLAAERILVALHEAAHFIVAAEYDIGVHKVEILGTGGQRCAQGSTGAVHIGHIDSVLSEARFYLAGVAHDLAMFAKQPSFGVAGDLLDSYAPFLRHCADTRVLAADVHALHQAEIFSVGDFLEARWDLIKSIACAFVVCSTASGEFDCWKTSALYQIVKRELSAPKRNSDYGDILDPEIIQRLQVAPEEKLNKYIIKCINRVNDSMREHRVEEFFSQVVATAQAQQRG